MSFLDNISPKLPGLPALAFNVLTAFSGSIKILDAFNPINLLFSTPDSVWGIFDDSNNPIVSPDTWLSVDYKNEWSLSDYPLEQGAFATYNKVNNPADIRVRMAIGAGNEQARIAFLLALNDAANSLALCTVVTPEVTYSNLNISHVDYRREQTNGSKIIIADVWLREIRDLSQTPTPNVMATASQGAGSIVNQALGGGIKLLAGTVKSIGSAVSTALGQVQVITPTAAQIATFI